MKVEIEGMEKAQVFYGLAKDGELVIRVGGPILYTDECIARAACHRDEHPVRVYVIVEDD
jgi:hypothetical protein